MYGFVNKALEHFLRATYGDDAWSEVARRAGLETESFEAMLIYEAGLTRRIEEAAASVLNRRREDILEDVGTYVVTDRALEAIRRLLRFGGLTFSAFMHSLGDVPGRARLAVPDLILPDIGVLEDEGGCFTVRCGPNDWGFTHVLMGIIRSMADDYGTLAIIAAEGSPAQGERIAVQVLLDDYWEGRSFALAQQGRVA